jgi:hypothetical protein
MIDEECAIFAAERAEREARAASAKAKKGAQLARRRRFGVWSLIGSARVR